MSSRSTSPKTPFGGQATEPRLTRRRLLGGLATMPALFGLSACNPSGEPELPPLGTTGRAALLLPLSGQHTKLGQVMAEAARLGGAVDGPGAEIALHDAGADETSAVAAANRAVEAGANMILGPLFSNQSQAVAAAVGARVPVISFSNNDAIAGRNLYVFGITPLQSAKAVLRFASARGMRRIAVAVPPGAYGEQAVAAARKVAPEFGITLSDPLQASDPGGLVSRLAAASGGRLPDAVYLPAASAGLAPMVDAVKEAGLQVLGSEQWATIPPHQLGALNQAWFAGPDPISFEAFALGLEERIEGEAGVTAGLAFDAANMARLLGRLGQQDPKGLHRFAGFNGVLGPFRFMETGLVDRQLSILEVREGTTILVA
ncbi:amino acid/amide ABC transporter substrate-binding protein (HAAT family) [Limimaricola soesokkakensis]|uniref:Amino acid/amide ABC transporter substrate-binding protein (HAAT family) n=1 Tax=Limimaricola soesokkakensis TaxID=1343159 RepID=A0A1X6YZF8_9RHOB|nr:penicillin-binding protein activator [Limimaricola soesokkakensis]PSK87904.1 amino acid/amide ABC transporter substrate-binding protein (HAAT family) [Limimaricola soesokkakensis]SLN35656.1 Penicillin-binding protein activator LpoA [Limimaricola soesokkakensis]